MNGNGNYSETGIGKICEITSRELIFGGFLPFGTNVRAPLGCSSVPRPTRSTMVCQVMLPRARNLHYFKTSSNDDDDRNNIIPNANAFIFKTLRYVPSNEREMERNNEK